MKNICLLFIAIATSIFPCFSMEREGEDSPCDKVHIEEMHTSTLIVPKELQCFADILMARKNPSIKVICAVQNGYCSPPCTWKIGTYVESTAEVQKHVNISLDSQHPYTALLMLDQALLRSPSRQKEAVEYAIDDILKNFEKKFELPHVISQSTTLSRSYSFQKAIQRLQPGSFRSLRELSRDMATLPEETVLQQEDVEKYLNQFGASIELTYIELTYRGRDSQKKIALDAHDIPEYIFDFMWRTLSLAPRRLLEPLERKRYCACTIDPACALIDINTKPFSSFIPDGFSLDEAELLQSLGGEIQPEMYHITMSPTFLDLPREKQENLLKPILQEIE